MPRISRRSLLQVSLAAVLVANSIFLSIHLLFTVPSLANCQLALVRLQATERNVDLPSVPTLSRFRQTTASYSAGSYVIDPLTKRWSYTFSPSQKVVGSFRYSITEGWLAVAEEIIQVAVDFSPK